MDPRLISRRRLLTAAGAGAAVAPLLGYMPKAMARSSSPTVAAVPVLAYHQLDNDPDVESITSTAFAAQMQYLHTNGYRTITSAHYLAWLAGVSVRLPSKPILITVDDGILNFLQPGASILRQHGFTAVAFIVSGFADQASAGNPDYVGWNATWSQLRNLSPAVYEFAFHAGPKGHLLQTFDPAVPYFYAGRMPGETDAQFEQRVIADISAGRARIDEELRRTGRLVSKVWAVPWNDLGQPGQPYDGPPGWLEQYANGAFQAVFLEDLSRNGIGKERFRFEVQGWMDETYFETALEGFLTSGAFSRTAPSA